MLLLAMGARDEKARRPRTLAAAIQDTELDYLAQCHLMPFRVRSRRDIAAKKGLRGGSRHLPAEDGP